MMKSRNQRICDGMNPPRPTTTSFDTLSGQRLLSLLKTYDKYKQQENPKELDDSDEKNIGNDDAAARIGVLVEEIVHILQQLTVVVQRQGLIRRNNNNNNNGTAMAKHILDSASITKQHHSTNSTKKKRKVVQHEALSLDDGTATSNNNNTSTADVQLLIMAMVRIIENYHSTDNDNHNNNNNTYPDRCIYTTATDLLTAACQYNITQQQQQSKNRSVDLCFLAEYELIASACKPFLNGIEKYLRRQYDGRTLSTTTTTEEIEEAMHEVTDYSITSSFRAVTCMIGLLGNKLIANRSSSSSSHQTNTITAILHKIQELAWRTLILVPLAHTAGPTTAAIRYLTTLTYASSTVVVSTNLEHIPNQMNRSMTWNQTWLDATSALFGLLQNFPQEKGSGKDKNEVVDGVGVMSDLVQQIILHEWIPAFQRMNSNDDDARVDQLLQMIQNLVSLLLTLLTREGVPANSNSDINCEIDIDMLLSILDGMVSLPSLAENKYYSTKKRLRDEATTVTTSGSMALPFSPQCIVTKIAIPIRLMGYELFQTTLTSLGSMNLLPFTRRITKILYQNILSSASNTVRHAIDPTNMMFGWNSNNKRGERWLHSSIISRTASIQTFQCLIQTFGIDVQQQLSIGANKTSGNHRNSHVELSIRIICATMIEELSLNGSFENNDVVRDWGTWDDHLKLVSAIASCLTVCLNCGGSYLSPTIRDLIDMVTSTSLLSIVHNNPTTAFGEVKTSMIQLGIAVTCTPWQDGAASTIATELISAAQSCAHDSDELVVTAATAALNVCTALHCSRVPPLQIITRSNDFLGENTSSSTVITAGTIEDKLRSTRNELNRLNAISHEKTTASLAKKSKTIVPVTSNQVPLEIASNGATTKNSKAIVQPLLMVDDGVMLLAEDSAEKVVVTSLLSDDIQESDTVNASKTESSSLLPDPATNADDEDFPMIVDCGPDEDDE